MNEPSEAKKLAYTIDWLIRARIKSLTYEDTDRGMALQAEAAMSAKEALLELERRLEEA